nr:CCR4-Not complex, subunit 3/ 5 [Tanacetum cinerariifolium]
MLSQGGLGGARPANPNTVISAQHHQPLMLTSSQDTGQAGWVACQTALSKNAANEEDPKVAYESDMRTGASGSLTEPTQTSRDVDLNGLAASLGGTPISLVA